MSNVSQIKASANAPTALRNIADQIESGELGDTEATVVVGSDVFHVGCVDSGEAAGNAVWNMTYGIHKLIDMANSE